MTTKDELRALASKATQGEWEVQDSCSWRRLGVVGGICGGVLCPTVDKRDGQPDLISYDGKTYENLRYIAAASPEAVIELLDENDADRKRVWQLERTLENIIDKIAGEQQDETTIDEEFHLKGLGEMMNKARATLNPD